MAVLGLRPCARAPSSRGKWGPLSIAVRGPPTTATSPAAEHRLQTRRLSNCGSRAQSLRGTWDPPRPGLEPASPALAGRFSTTAPPGKPQALFLMLSLKTCSKGGREGDARGKRHGDICICITDSFCYKAETNTPLYSNYTPIKMF